MKLKKIDTSIGLVVAVASCFVAGCAGEPSSADDTRASNEDGISQSADALSAIAPCMRRGMTWVRRSQNFDVDSVGYDATTNAFDGDTTCYSSLPLLCLRKSGAGLPVPPYVNNSSTYNQWSGGYIAATKAHVGTDMSSQAAADSICEQELGAGWRMAEFHDGWGWNFQAYGAAPHPGRFWTAINDQLANCWNSACQ